MFSKKTAVNKANIQYIEELTWENARKDVADSCKTLSNIIDNISPDKNYHLLRIRYPFGAKILEKAKFYLPDEYGRSIPITDIKIPQKIRSQLNYSFCPLGIITKNNIETFREIDGKVFSIAFHGGDLDLGIWEHFGWTTPYSITAGARSLYMLPKISETISHKRLKNEFDISASPPKRLFDHWQVFTQLAASSNFLNQWHCELIVLPQTWINQIKHDPAWRELNLYLWQKGWKHCKYARNKSILDVIGEVFAQNLKTNNLKFDPYLIATLNHLFLLGAGVLPASFPATGTDEAGPLKEIQEIYANIYNLQNIPTIMQPKYFGHKDKLPVYYSLQNPTLLESIPKSKQATSTIEIVRNLKELIEHFIKIIPWQIFEQSAQPFCDIINRLRFDFFHSDTFAYGPHIRPSTEMPQYDQALIYNPIPQQDKKFATNSSFLKGCVRINHLPILS